MHERQDYDHVLRGGHIREDNHKEVKDFVHKIDKKLGSLEGRFVEFFERYNVPYQRGQGKNLIRNLMLAID
jgi:hypothetical protein